MSGKQGLDFLFIGESADNAEILSNTLRNKGVLAKYTHVESEQELLETITGSTEQYDLIVSEKEHEDYPPDKVLKTFKEKGVIQPLVVMLFDEDQSYRNDIMNQGAADVIIYTDAEHSYLVVAREAAGFAYKRDATDISSRLESCENKARVLIDSSKTAMAFINEGLHVYSNAEYAKLLGYDDVDDMIAVSLIDVVDEGSRDVVTDFLKMSREHFEDTELSVRLVKADGDDFKAALELSPGVFDSEPCVQVTAREIIEENPDLVRKDIDPITGLPTLTSFVSKFKDKIVSIDAGKGCSMLYITVDDFDTVKRSVGLDNVDTLVKSIADTISSCIRDNDIATRISEHAFAAMVDDVTNESLLEVSGRIRESVAAIEGAGVTSSIGAYVISSSSESFDFVIRHAESASHAVIEKGGNAVDIYDPLKSGAGDEEAEEWSSKINHALKNDAFTLHYQPIDTLHGGSEHIYESMLRMNMSDELVLPSKFMAPAERTGLMQKIDQWVILHVVSEIKRSKDDVLIAKISGDTLNNKALSSFVKQVVEKSQIDSARLIFDISESVAITHLKQVRQFAASMQELGCRVLISNFGQSAQSSSIIKRLDANFVKFEGTLIQDIFNSDDKKERLSGLIEMVAELGMSSIASHIEDPLSLTFLYKSGVTMIQGNFLAEPSPNRSHSFDS